MKKSKKHATPVLPGMFGDAPKPLPDAPSAPDVTPVEPVVSHAMKVYEVIVDSGGTTDDEVAEKTGLELADVIRERQILVDAGLVRMSGESRQIRNGRMGIVWVRR